MKQKPKPLADLQY